MPYRTAPTQRTEAWLKEAALRARAHRLHALMQGRFGAAIAAELDWQVRREHWVEIMERQGWGRATTLERLARDERDGDARCRAILEEEPGMHLPDLLDRLGLDKRSWITRHVTIRNAAT
jgi:hypothetical protein